MQRVFDSSGGLSDTSGNTGTGGLVTQFIVDNPSTVPEPSALALLAIGLLGMGFRARRG